MDLFRIIVLIIVCFAIVLLLIYSILQKQAEALIKEIGRENVLLVSINANFLGQQSIGYMQFSGNGVLILTKEKLYFKRLAPKKFIEIPLKNIELIEECWSHLGRAKGGKLLKIIYRNESNVMDSCAWWVRNRREWIQKIEEARMHI